MNEQEKRDETLKRSSPLQPCVKPGGTELLFLLLCTPEEHGRDAALLKYCRHGGCAWYSPALKGVQPALDS